MRVKLSDRDLILIAGIAVAVIIVITVMTMDLALPQTESNAKLPLLMKFSEPWVMLKKISHRLSLTTF
jgi:hypothetical protein